MTSSITRPDLRPTAVAATVDEARLSITLADGRQLIVPLAWFEWLQVATSAQRSDLEIIEGGRGIWWDELDEGVSVPTLLSLPHH
jgi:Protein of unknown function (DUF2442)